MLPIPPGPNAAESLREIAMTPEHQLTHLPKNHFVGCAGELSYLMLNIAERLTEPRLPRRCQSCHQISADV